MLKPSSPPLPEKLLLRRSALLMILLTATILLCGACLKRKNVTLQIGNQTETITSYAFTVKQFLAGAGVTLGPADRVVPGPATALKDGETIRVYRAVPVSVTADGTVQRFLTTSRTVYAVVRQAGLTLGPLDQVEPGLFSRVTAGMKIQVHRIVVTRETREVPVPFTTTVLDDPSLVGRTAHLLQAGRPGLARQVWRAVYTDGTLTATTLLSNVLLAAPRPAVLVQNRPWTLSRGGMPDRFFRAVVMRATAYSPTGNRTATGTIPKIGTIAVDPRVIPLGTRLYVQGYGYGTALDTGGAIKGNRVDVFFNTAREADDWGVRDVKVYVLSPATRRAPV